jgi:PTH1 family peptidyl-tRNA hydrolase
VKLVVGLGNPGPEYETTRHNVGWWVIDHLADVWRFPPWRAVPDARAADGEVDGRRVRLLKPQTFMNLSGRAVRAAAAFFKWAPEQLLVVFDDVALPMGTLRFREAGSHGGHNGLRSILAELGSDRFPRLKIGIGGAGPGDLTGHVLGKFRPDERDAMENTLASAVEAVQLALSQGIAAAANRYNTRKKPATSDTDEQEI